MFFEHDWPVGDEALAVATSWADESGNVLAYDIRINGTVPWSTTGAGDAFDLQAAVAHEVGHVLGLEHSSDTEATMYASHSLGEDWRQVLHEDDRAAIQFVYGDGPADSPEELPFRGCHTSGSAPGFVWVLSSLCLAFARRRS